MLSCAEEAVRANESPRRSARRRPRRDERGMRLAAAALLFEVVRADATVKDEEILGRRERPCRAPSASRARRADEARSSRRRRPREARARCTSSHPSSTTSWLPTRSKTARRAAVAGRLRRRRKGRPRGAPGAAHRRPPPLPHLDFIDAKTARAPRAVSREPEAGGPGPPLRTAGLTRVAHRTGGAPLIMAFALLAAWRLAAIGSTAGSAGYGPTSSAPARAGRRGSRRRMRARPRREAHLAAAVRRVAIERQRGVGQARRRLDRLPDDSVDARPRASGARSTPRRRARTRPGRRGAPRAARRRCPSGVKRVGDGLARPRRRRRPAPASPRDVLLGRAGAGSPERGHVAPAAPAAPARATTWRTPTARRKRSAPRPSGRTRAAPSPGRTAAG